MDLSGCHFSDPYLLSGIQMLKLSNYEWLTVLKLDGCQISLKALNIIRDFLHQQQLILNGSSTLQELSLERCGLKFYKEEAKKKDQGGQNLKALFAEAIKKKVSDKIKTEKSVLLEILG